MTKSTFPSSSYISAIFNITDYLALFFKAYISQMDINGLKEIYGINKDHGIL